jgi:hypothetical protein
MLVQISSLVNTDLRAFSGLTDLLTQGVNGVRPLIAEADDGDSFVVYYIRYEGKITKGVASQYQLITQSWATSYDVSLAIADQVEAALNASNNYSNYVSAEPKFSEQGIIYTEQIFNIKQ